MEAKKNPLSLQLKVDDFIPATPDEKESLVVMRESVGFWQDGFRRFKKNKIAMTAFVVVVIMIILAFIVPVFYPYAYEEQVKGSERLGIMEYSKKEIERMTCLWQEI